MALSQLAVTHQKPRIACIIPTYNGKHELKRLLQSLETQTANFDLFIVDSTSTDGTTELARKHCKNLTIVPSREFNHGGTRQLIIEKNPEYEIYVLLTQDAYLENQNSIASIVEPFSDPKVAAVCGRQLPHTNATDIAKHARFFNYTNKTQIKSISDAPVLGIKAPFMSNSFSAYRGVALADIGGFPSHVILSEDMYVGAKALLAGWKIAYAGNAHCRHSHNYTMIEEFRRYFDIGVFHAREKWIREEFGGAGGEGLRYVISEIKFLGINRLYRWPASILRNSFKFLGYKLGQVESYLPNKIKRKLSMSKSFWGS